MARRVPWPHAEPAHERRPTPRNGESDSLKTEEKTRPSMPACERTESYDLDLT